MSSSGSILIELAGYLALMGTGVVLGSIGAGGSMLAIPILLYCFSLDMETASAYSLFIVGMTSLAGAALKRRQQLVAVKVGVTFGAPSVVAAFIARNSLLPALPDSLWRIGSVTITKDGFLLVLFTLLMIASSAMILMGIKAEGSAFGTPRRFCVAVAGAVVGLIAGISGIGGGFLIMPALMIFGGLSFGYALGTTLFIIACNSLLGFCGDVLSHSIDWEFLLTLTLLAVLGMLAGTGTHVALSRYSTSRGLAWVSLATAVAMMGHGLWAA